MDIKHALTAAAFGFALALSPAAFADETTGNADAAETETVDYAAQVAALEGDAEKGAKAYRRCKACHVIDEPKNRTGPHQVGIIGRPAGAVEGFNYSDAMANSGLVWDVPTLQAYLADPKGYLEGTKMNFRGLRKEAQINDVITYLFEAGGVYEAPTN